MNFWDIILSVFWFMILLAWIMLLVSIITDIFRDHEMSGWVKALWTLFLIVVPWLGGIVYLIARGSSMNRRARDHAMLRQQEYGEYSAYVGRGATSSADELTKLADLRDRGALSQEEFQQAKAAALGQQEEPAPTTDGRRTTVPSA